jgi:hypothetical protein
LCYTHSLYLNLRLSERVVTGRLQVVQSCCTTLLKQRGDIITSKILSCLFRN